MLYHLISYVVFVFGFIGLFIARYSGRRAEIRDAKHLARPVAEYEVVLIPVAQEYAVVQPDDFTNLMARKVARRVLYSLQDQGMQVCEVKKSGYQVVIRNTTKGYHKVHGWEHSYWAKIDDNTDTVIGFASIDEPDFHDHMLRLQDEAQSKVAVLSSIA